MFSFRFVVWARWAPLALTCMAIHLGTATVARGLENEPEPPRLEFLFEETVTLGSDIKVGSTPRGLRNITPITGGSIRGPRLNGRVLPGGWDWQLLGADCLWLEANYFIQTDDGTVINVINRGSWCAHHGKDDIVTLTTPMFEAPKGKYEWLNYGAYVGTAEDLSKPGHPKVRIRFFGAQLPAR